MGFLCKTIHIHSERIKFHERVQLRNETPLVDLKTAAVFPSFSTLTGKLTATQLLVGCSSEAPQEKLCSIQGPNTEKLKKEIKATEYV